MQNRINLLVLLVVQCGLHLVCAFGKMNPNHNNSKLMAAQNGDNQRGFFAPVAEFFNNLDNVADDFFYKRMGKGEIFYGKRKYNPSGDVEGNYDGMGLSDKGKIDMAREYKEERLEEKRMRDEIRMLREEFDKRNSQ